MIVFAGLMTIWYNYQVTNFNDTVCLALQIAGGRGKRRRICL